MRGGPRGRRMSGREADMRGTRSRWETGVVLGIGLLVAACEATSAGTDKGLGDAGYDAARVDADASDAGPSDAGPDLGPPCDGPPGLYESRSCRLLAAGVRAYEVRYPLWTDGVDKTRFVYLPPAEVIDTTDPDNWRFPIGTRLYKTFSRDGKRLETRLLEKRSVGWDYRVFAWNSDQNRVTEVGAQVMPDVLGTTHDIPSRNMCIRCHTGAVDAPLGFSAVQLNHREPGVTLTGLVADGALSAAVTSTDATIPGDAGAQDALGYLHGNCGNCHRTGGDADMRMPSEPKLRLWVDVGTASVMATAAYQSAYDVTSVWTQDMATLRIDSTHPQRSTILVRMASREGATAMPPLGTEVADTNGVALVRQWVESL